MDLRFATDPDDPLAQPTRARLVDFLPRDPDEAGCMIELAGAPREA